eukprot:TRINITY_DN3297_c0_g1_i4.p1 TRINITY_DN3297_c0_g1~~TRINITY_DN3297_c0_g1_i4.p1  ORF type:complete len:735 (-),score=99.90 TRINITY_DN3297_c0_g1_i4:3335-5362(-)
MQQLEEQQLKEQQLLQQVELLQTQVDELQDQLARFNETSNHSEDYWLQCSPEELLELIAADKKIYHEGLRRVTLESLKASDNTSARMTLMQLNSVGLAELKDQMTEEQELLESIQPDYAFRLTEEGEAIILGQKIVPVWSSQAAQRFQSQGRENETLQDRWKRVFRHIMRNVAVRRHFVGLVREMTKFETKMTRYWFIWYNDDGTSDLHYMYMIPCYFDNGDSWRRAFIMLMNVRPHPMEKQERFLRDFMGLRYAPSIMTLVSKEGWVLSQNAASVAYHGILAEDSFEQQDKCTSCQLVKKRHFIKDLFGHDDDLFEQMESAIEMGNSWSKKLNVPSAIQPDARSDTWHHVQITKMRDPVTSQDAYVVAQTDVTMPVLQQSKIKDMLKREKNLLREMLPQHVIDKLLYKVKGFDIQDLVDSRGNLQRSSSSDLDLRLMTEVDVKELATEHPEVTVLFSDIKGFTAMSQSVPPSAVMQFLNRLYSRWDEMLQAFGVYKVETIGDAYMVAAGLMTTIEEPDGTVKYQVGKVDPRHAHRALGFGQAMLAAARDLETPHGEPVQIRIGIHSGPVVSGVVGSKMPRFCLFGDTVNTANRMESTGTPGRIHVSHVTCGLLQDMEWEATGGVDVKGKGVMQTFLLKCDPEKENESEAMLGSCQMDSREGLDQLLINGNWQEA